MSSLPAHLVPATRARRFFAGLLNFMSAGFLLLLASATADGPIVSGRYGVVERYYAVGLMTVLWLISLLNKKSLGAVFCVLEIRTPNGDRPTLKQMLVRSAPAYSLVVICVFPAPPLPVSWDLVRLLLFLVMLLAILANGLVGVITHSSLLDRISKTLVLQLQLPDHAKPRIAGVRIV